MGRIGTALRDLAAVRVRAVTIGQYLAPSPDHHPVHRYYTPDEFSLLRDGAQQLFEKVQAGPLVRSSYHADASAPSVV